MPETRKREILGDVCLVETYGTKMRFLTSGTLNGVTEEDVHKAQEANIHVELFPDGSADFSVQRLVPWETCDADLEAFHDEILNRIEETLGLEGGEITSSSWNAGHSTPKWDHIMTKEEQTIVREVRRNNAPER